MAAISFIRCHRVAAQRGGSCSGRSRAPSPGPSTLCGSRPSTSTLHDRPAAAAGQASQLSAEDVLQYGASARKPRQASSACRCRPRSDATASSPSPRTSYASVEGCLRDPGFAADLTNGRSILRLPQHEGDLCLRRPRCFHGSLRLLAHTAKLEFSSLAQPRNREAGQTAPAPELNAQISDALNWPNSQHRKYQSLNCLSAAYVQAGSQPEKAGINTKLVMNCLVVKMERCRRR